MPAIAFLRQLLQLTVWQRRCPSMHVIISISHVFLLQAISRRLWPWHSRVC